MEILATFAYGIVSIIILFAYFLFTSLIYYGIIYPHEPTFWKYVKVAVAIPAILFAIYTIGLVVKLGLS